MGQKPISESKNNDEKISKIESHQVFFMYTISKKRKMKKRRMEKLKPENYGRKMTKKSPDSSFTPQNTSDFF